MKIVVKNGADCNIRLWFPTGLLLNPLTALFIPSVLEPQGIHVTHAQAAALVKALSESERRLKNRPLVEVSSQDAEIIIRL